jgi:hypothetical protein
LDELQGAFPRGNLAAQLSLLDSLQDGMEGGAGLIAHGDKVVARDEPGRPDLLGRGLRQEPPDVIVVVKMPVA